MSHSRKDLPQSQIELTITVPPSEYEKHLAPAAERLSKRGGVKGFRPGKVPYEVMKREVGEMNILREALEIIVQKAFYEALSAEKLDTIGMPKVDIEKLAPGNDVVFKATVALLPQVKLADIEKIKARRTVKSIEKDNIQKTLDALRGMQATEKVKDGPAGGSDKVTLDMNMAVDRVPVEGGHAKDYQVYLSEEHYIPGFNKEILGLKKGDEKTFQLLFPKDHYQKMLAGKNVDITVRVNDVHERLLPELNDAFAATLGQTSIESLTALVRKNMETEAEQKADQQFETEIMETLIEKSTFDPIPEVLIDAERQKMFFELKRDLERNGVTIEQYLSDIKKKEAELFVEFKTQAEKRAKAALIMRTLSLAHNLKPTDEEIQGEIEHLSHVYRENSEYLENLKRPEVRDTVATMIQNRKVMGWLKEQLPTGKSEKNG